MQFLSHDGLIYFWEQAKEYINAKCEQSKGSYIGDTAPENTNLLWVDTSSGGILKYYNGTSWVAIKAVWG